MSSRRWKPALIAMGAVAALGAAASPAMAATATISSSNRVSVSGQSSDKDQIVVSYDSGLDLYRVTDTAGITASGTCSDVDSTTVTCPGAGVVAITVKSGGGADVIRLDQATIPATIEGSPDGGSGNDLVFGSRADDSVGGGSGDDIVDGGPGADEMRGGSNTDTILYADRTTPIHVDIGSGTEDDGNEVDQSGNARDTVRDDIERVSGGSAGDTIVGDRSSEVLYGAEGGDTLIGGRGNDGLSGAGGDDLIVGQDGNDTGRGESGADRLFGGGGNDKLIGGLDNDSITGESGVDRLKGKSGIDRLFARDGTRDARINCGPGANKLEKVKRDKRIDPKARRC